MTDGRQHADALGRTINIGDYVAYPSHNSLLIGRVSKLTAKMVVVTRNTTRRVSESRKYSQDLVLLEHEYVIQYLLTQQ